MKNCSQYRYFVAQRYRLTEEAANRIIEQAPPVTWKMFIANNNKWSACLLERESPEAVAEYIKEQRAQPNPYHLKQDFRVLRNNGRIYDEEYYDIEE